MRFRLLVSLVVFIGSYLPLSLILLAQNFDYSAIGKPICLKVWEDGCSIPLRNPALSISALLACTLCFLVTVLVLAVVRPKHEVVVKSADYVPADLMNYTLPYVVSFMSLDYQEPGTFIGFLIFMGWMFLITHRSGQILLNPVLIVFGWRLYDLTYHFVGESTDRQARALSLGPVGPGERLAQIAVQDILIVKPESRS